MSLEFDSEEEMENEDGFNSNHLDHSIASLDISETSSGGNEQQEEEDIADESFHQALKDRERYIRRVSMAIGNNGMLSHLPRPLSSKSSLVEDILEEEEEEDEEEDEDEEKGDIQPQERHDEHQEEKQEERDDEEQEETRTAAASSLTSLPGIAQYILKKKQQVTPTDAVTKSKAIDRMTTKAKDKFIAGKKSDPSKQKVPLLNTNSTFHPNSRWKDRWDTAIMLLLLYTTVAVPYQSSFGKDSSQPLGFTIMDTILDLAFALDMLITCNTAYVLNNETYHTSRQKILRRYLTTWFFPDLVATFPVHLVINHMGFDRFGKFTKLPRFLRVLKIARLLRLLQFGRIQHFASKLEAMYGFHPGVLRLAKLFFSILMVTHGLGCIWHLIPLLENDFEPPLAKSWLGIHGIATGSVYERYYASVYWSFTTLTTVGFGDIYGNTVAEKSYSIFVMAIGVTWYAFIVSSMSSILSGFDTHNMAMREKLNRLNQFMKDVNLPKELRYRLRDHLERASYDKANVYEATQLLSNMPAVLRSEVLFFMHRKIIGQIHALKDESKQLAVTIVLALRPMFVQKLELVVEEGVHSEEMYFLIDGQVAVVKFGQVVSDISRGESFGEVGCILTDTRSATIEARSFCELYSLSKTDMISMMSDYPQFALDLRNQALKRLERDHELWKNKMMRREKPEEVEQVFLQRQAILSSSGYLTTEDEEFIHQERLQKEGRVEPSVSRSISCVASLNDGQRLNVPSNSDDIQTLVAASESRMLEQVSAFQRQMLDQVQHMVRKVEQKKKDVAKQ